MALDPNIALNVQAPKFNNPFEQLAQIRAQQQEQQLRQQQISASQAQEADRRNALAAAQRLQQQQTQIDGLMQHAFTQDPDTGVSSFNRDTFQQGLIQGGLGHLYPQLSETLDKLDESSAKIAAERRNLVARSLMGIEQAGNTPEAVTSAVAYLQKNNAITPDHAAPILQAIAADPSPENVKSMLGKVGAAIPEYRDLQNAEESRKATLAKTQAETAKLQSEAKNGPPVTEADLDAQAQTLLAKQAQGQPLTTVEAANLKAYQERKRTVSDPAALAAADRQNATIAAQIAQQGRAQDFTQKQAGRQELTTKIEQPYLDAKEKADTLRNVIASAQQGNMVAGSIQPLLATLGFVTMEGVKRINSTELQQVAGAGSLLERIKGQVAGLSAGQPMSPKLQNDLKQLTGVLEQSARKKYEQGFNATTKRYGLTDEQMIADPNAPAGATTGGALSYDDYLKAKGGR